MANIPQSDKSQSEGGRQVGGPNGGLGGTDKDVGTGTGTITAGGSVGTAAGGVGRDTPPRAGTMTEHDKHVAMAGQANQRARTQAGGAAAEVEGSLQQGFAELESLFEKLRDRMTEFGGQATGQMKEQLAQSMSMTKEELGKLGDQVYRQGRDTVVTVERAVQEKPLAYLCGSFLVGFFVAHLFRR